MTVFVYVNTSKQVVATSSTSRCSRMATSRRPGLRKTTPKAAFEHE